MTTDVQTITPRKRRWLACLLLCLGLAVLAFLLRAPLFTALAKGWMINQPLAKADAIVVLGGGANFRSFEAVRLYREGWASVILVINSELRATDQAGFTLPESQLVQRILLSNAVPGQAIQIIGDNLTSTFDDIRSVAQWAKENQASSFIIPTGPFHARRVRWAFQRIMGPSARLIVTSIQPRICERWWKDPDTILEFHNELLKFAYYEVKYF